MTNTDDDGREAIVGKKLDPVIPFSIGPFRGRMVTGGLGHLTFEAKSDGR